jgi:hypothetical protein
MHSSHKSGAMLIKHGNCSAVSCRELALGSFSATRRKNRNLRGLIAFALRNPKSFLHAQHLAIDLLDLCHQRFLSFGEPNQFLQPRARDISQHFPILTLKIDNVNRAGLCLDLIRLIHRGENAPGHDEHAAGQCKYNYPHRWDRC